MRRVVLLTCAVLLCAAPASQAATTLGVSDQNPLTFTNPLYKPLKFKVARYIAPYDALSYKPQATLLDQWIQNARADHQRILISFEHSRRPGHQKQGAVDRPVHERAEEVQEEVPVREGVVALERGQPLPDRRPQRGPAHRDLLDQEGRPQARGAVLRGGPQGLRLEVQDRRAGHPRRRQRRRGRELHPRLQALRQADPEDLGLPQLLRHQPLLDHAHEAAARRHRARARCG